jgi:hypothetical protein
VVVDEGAPRGGLFELEVDTVYRVVDRRTGVVALEAHGEYSASFGGDGTWEPGTTTGVVGVEISEDPQEAIVRHGDGSVTRVPLPP